MCSNSSARVTSAPLSYPMPGWNVCVDFPIKPGLGDFLDELDRESWNLEADSTWPRSHEPAPQTSTRCTRDGRLAEDPQ